MAGIRSVTWLIIVTGPKRTHSQILPKHDPLTWRHNLGWQSLIRLANTTHIALDACGKKKKKKGEVEPDPHHYWVNRLNGLNRSNSLNFVWTTPHLLKTCMIHLEKGKRKTKWKRKEKVWTPWIQPNLVSTLLVIWIMPMWTWWRATACSSPGPISPAIRLRPGPFAKYKH